MGIAFTNANWPLHAKLDVLLAGAERSAGRLAPEGGPGPPSYLAAEPEKPATRAQGLAIDGLAGIARRVARIEIGTLRRDVPSAARPELGKGR